MLKHAFFTFLPEGRRMFDLSTLIIKFRFFFAVYGTLKVEIFDRIEYLIHQFVV